MSPRRTPQPGAAAANAAVVFQAAALCLSYPDPDVLGRLDVVEQALAGTTTAERFAPVLAHLGARTAAEAQSFHVQEFDLSRRHALHLSYWTDGDTRRRGEVLAEIKQTYRDSGLVVDTHGELPDHLPMVLEFAVADPEAGVALLQRFRASLELIKFGLLDDGLPHAGVVQAVCAALPGESPASAAEVHRAYSNPQPIELVGIGASQLVRS